MLVLVYVGEVHAEEGIGKPGREGRVGEIGVNDKDGDEREDNTKAKLMEAAEGILGPYDTIAVGIEKVTMLLEDCLVRVIARPVFVCGAVWLVFGGSDVRAGSA